MLQKKLQTSGRISAVDLDAAACISREADQIPDVVNFLYKFRHTDSAPEQLDSTGYAIIRLLLKYDETDLLFKILNDPINYGIFPNYHLGCLLMNQFLTKENIPAAAKIATLYMQQEMFECTLLNFLSVYSLLKFIELPKEQRIFDDKIQPKPVEEEIDEEQENIKMFRYPFLKNFYNDQLFDLVEEDQLCGKSLEWFSFHLDNSPFKDDIRLLGLIFRPKLSETIDLLNSGILKQINSKTLELCRIRVGELLGQIPEEKRQEDPDYSILEKINELLGEPQSIDSNIALSDEFWSSFKSNLNKAEEALMEAQKQEFQEWNRLRTARIESQAERFNLRLRLEEIEKKREELAEKKEILYFFDDRAELEDLAAYHEKLWEESKLVKQRDSMTEEERVAEMLKKGGKRERR
uniref:Uncharacterized protein n=1 Tax=Acrobeloides nanus TaxID=290746 RepID=A0A914BVV3_9BILA